jgi:CheY-like chemotaxis protein
MTLRGRCACALPNAAHLIGSITPVIVEDKMARTAPESTIQLSLAASPLLIADESAVTRRSLISIIKDSNPDIQVLEAGTGSEALQAMHHHRPKVGFFSIQLPDLSGSEVLAQAKSEGCQLLGVLTSTRPLSHWVELSLRVNAYEFLRKPFHRMNVLELLRAHERMSEPLEVLVVDDSMTARDIVRRVLGGSRFQMNVDDTDSGQHALKLMELKDYNLALIDYKMVEMNGLETACHAKSIAPNIDIVLMSGQSFKGKEQGLAAFNVVDFLLKPFYAHDVDRMLHKVLKLYRPYLLNAMLRPLQPILHERVGEASSSASPLSESGRFA